MVLIKIKLFIYKSKKVKILLLGCILTALFFTTQIFQLNGTVFSKILLMVISLAYWLPLVSVLLSNIVIDERFITINGSIFYRKKIPLKSITNVRLAKSGERIVRGFPTYSKNIIVIEYGKDEKSYFSVRKDDINEVLHIIMKIINYN